MSDGTAGSILTSTCEPWPWGRCSVKRVRSSADPASHLRDGAWASVAADDPHPGWPTAASAAHPRPLYSVLGIATCDRQAIEGILDRSGDGRPRAPQGRSEPAGAERGVQSVPPSFD